MDKIYHIRINKDYATGVIEELRKNEAVQLIPDEEAFSVPEWQIKEVQRRIENSKNYPESMINEDVFLGMLNEE